MSDAVVDRIRAAEARADLKLAKISDLMAAPDSPLSQDESDGSTRLSQEESRRLSHLARVESEAMLLTQEVCPSTQVIRKFYSCNSHALAARGSQVNDDDSSSYYSSSSGSSHSSLDRGANNMVDLRELIAVAEVRADLKLAKMAGKSTTIVANPEFRDCLIRAAVVKADQKLAVSAFVI